MNYTGLALTLRRVLEDRYSEMIQIKTSGGSGADGGRSPSDIRASSGLISPTIRKTGAGRTGRIVVIGGGAIGLSTAVQLQKELKSLGPESPWNQPITLMADKFERDTVSDGAAGSFRPTGDYIPGVPKQRLRQWCEDSFRYYSQLLNSSEASEAGVSAISGHHVFIQEKVERDQMYKDVVFNFRQADAKEVTRFYTNLKDPKFAVFFTTLMVECRWFLPYLMKKFKIEGGIVQEKHINNLNELMEDFDLIVNCTGSGSRNLVGDQSITPIRGQMLRVKAPWIKNFLYVDNNCWIIPGKEWVIIGGTRQVNDDDVKPREEDSKSLMDRAVSCIPSLQKAEILEAWVGFRPAREPIRLEFEYVGSNKFPVLHNYGHGGNGVSLAWGTGTEAARLILNYIRPAKL